jgi:hypothetical protein
MVKWDVEVEEFSMGLLDFLLNLVHQKVETPAFPVSYFKGPVRFIPYPSDTED